MKGKKWNEEEVVAISDVPRREAVALFRISTRRDCLAEHIS